VDGRRHGCIVSSFAQVTSSYPPKFTVTINRDNETRKAVESAGSFAVTLLAEDCPESIIDEFGYRSGRVKDKFDGHDVGTDQSGNPWLKEHMVSRISCRVLNQVEIGNYILFVGEATEAEVLDDRPILTVTAFTNRGKTVPPKATIYRTVEIKGYTCTVCGYVYEGENPPPADYRCPVCGAAASQFVEIQPK
jgi:flavin reductase (DIM6/NTAB) family NADH-FMN oxidoreductase RutF